MAAMMETDQYKQEIRAINIDGSLQFRNCYMEWLRCWTRTPFITHHAQSLAAAMEYSVGLRQRFGGSR